MIAKNPKVDWYFDKEGPWKVEVNRLRRIILDCHLVEDLKWGCPCYTYEGRNIVLVHVFKDYCAVLFFKGALLKDEAKLLIRQTENVQVTRQMRFTSLAAVDDRAAPLRDYIFAAVEIEEKGLKAPMKKTEDFAVPEEFKQYLEETAGLKAAFESLSPGRQRGYLLHFSSAKQAGTRIARIEKYLPKILSGKGLND
ncbi:MAG TPA: DUF1801 domain-containing protein [Edaphocola sp.]|nr:DUF1801 domain-containing protein [Edaphocola sp.]